MNLTTIDYAFIFIFFSITLGIGIWVSKKSKESTSEYFLSGRNMPWWLLGVSMVATTFSTDTPNLVTDIVRTNGVSGNWVWWAFLLTGMLTVFIYAKLWRKSSVTTDLEFYELRYGGKPAKFLRGFRSLYLGVFFNVLAMAGVTLAAIKIGEVMLGLTPIQTIGIASVVTVVFSAIGGFKGVVYTDFLLFFVAMVGAIGAAVVSVNHPDVDGLGNLLTHPNVVDKLSILPDFSNKELLISIFIIPLAVQWWSAWYPGAEPGGGGYIAQRMLASKDENHAIGATFFFNILHYALRPWPWIIVALASLVVFPDLASIKEAFPNVSDSKLGQDLAYPAMLTFLPKGLAGIVLTSLIAAYMSTISTHLNWGASYIVNDFYKENINPNASEKALVNVGKIATVVLMILSAILALSFTNALEIFKFILMFGAGTGLIFLLRWFWWRINAWSEISAMLASGVFSLIFHFNSEALFGANGVFESYWQFPLVVLCTTIVWVLVTIFTKPEDDKVLIDFYKKIQPKKEGWSYVLQKAKEQGIVIEEKEVSTNLTDGLLAVFIGCVLVFSCLFATGNWIYGNYGIAVGLSVLALISALGLLKLWKKIKVNFL
ncbi:sodium:solute symporter family protein [Tenacibaculum amylolyticum]|uniref:sodium:solute symporter family protein n=1 Tax=Tenacibaculum amylolyticum TaxID=104269 RepID=UPI003893CFD5